MGIDQILKIEFFFLSICIVFLLYGFIKFLHKVWWNPIHITKILSSQGIKGPPYKFLHGNTKEIFKMINDSNIKPLKDLSHNIFPKLQPFQNSCLKIYGK